jgi:hypothetical protein
LTVTVSVAQRRARLVERHRLAVAADSVVDAVDAMIALHGTDPTAVYLSAWARTGCGAEQLDEAIYVERSLVRMLGMRRTMFVVPAGLVPVVQAACTDDVARRLRRQLEKDLTAGGVGDGDPGGWLRDVGSGVLRVLDARGGGASGAQLSAGEPRLRTQLSASLDKSYGGTFNITSRVLTLLGAEGHLVRGHRRGGWSSGQFEWFAASTWLGGPAADGGLDGGAARVELARRWLRSFGPAPVSDLQWWGGWTGGQTKAALAALPTVEVALDGQPGVALADDLEFSSAATTAVATLLPALDPTPMGWQARDWFLGQHRAALFDRTGNIGPTVWWEGRVVGGWAQRASGEIVLRLLEDIGADGAAAVSGQAARLEAWLGANRVTPRFRTPLERELSA